MKKNYEMDMCSGPILGKLLTFTIPLIFSGILQLLFNAADVIVVGRFAGSQSLAAVGSTTALINLMINICPWVSMLSWQDITEQSGKKTCRIRSIRPWRSASSAVFF